MNQTNWQELVEQLSDVDRQYRVAFEPGLSNEEVLAAESRFGIHFPPDLREFLQTALPSGPPFPNWRSDDAGKLREWLELPREGVLFDVEHNNFWLEEWGQPPSTLEDALRIVNELIDAAPKLIPIYYHRMMPDEPREPGNPVFSVHQTDIIHYGFDLADYLRAEFGIPGRLPWPEHVRPIRFWDIDRFQEVRWNGPVVFDNRRGLLP